MKKKSLIHSTDTIWQIALPIDLHLPPVVGLKFVIESELRATTTRSATCPANFSRHKPNNIHIK